MAPTAAQREREREKEKAAKRERAQLRKLVADLKMTRAQRDVLSWLINHWLRHRESKGGVIHPGIRKIEMGARCCERTVRSTLRILEGIGALVPIGSRNGEDGRATEYRLNRVALHTVATSGLGIREYLNRAAKIAAPPGGKIAAQIAPRSSVTEPPSNNPTAEATEPPQSVTINDPDSDRRALAVAMGADPDTGELPPAGVPDEVPAIDITPTGHARRTRHAR